MKIVLLTNILTPYRKFLYDKLYESFKSKGIVFNVVVMAETEPNRVWKYEEYKTEYSILLKNRTVTIANMYIHFNTKFKETLIKLSPNIVVAAGGYMLPSILEAIWLRKNLKYKILFWSESHLEEIRNYNKLKIAIRELIRKSIYNKFDGFWYAGKLSLNFIKKYVRTDVNLYFMPNLIDNSSFIKSIDASKSDIDILRTKMSISHNKFVFVCPARLTLVKGIHTFIELFKKCKNKDKVTVLIPGDGELKQQLKKMIEDENLDIRLVGYKSQLDIITLYSIADCFLMPSLSDPNPLTCIEALWSGLPMIVSTHVGNFPEIIKPSENGFVFDYANQPEAVELFDRLIASDKKWRENARKVSLEIAKDLYDPDKAVDRIVSETREVLCSNF